MPATCFLNPTGSEGSSIIEVLLSLLLISISTLGLAALQISAKQLGHQASQRTQAVNLAADLLERMRANRDALSGYAVAGIGMASGTAVGMPASDCRQYGCNATERVAWDLWDWQGALNGASTVGPGGGLARALACIQIEGRRVLVTISWHGTVRYRAPEIGIGCTAVIDSDSGSSRQTLRLVSYVGKGAA